MTRSSLAALLALSTTFVQPAAASSSVPYHSDGFYMDFSRDCTAVATPKPGRKLQVTLVRIDIGPYYSNQAGIVLYRDAKCLHAVAAHTPQMTGLTVVPFNPALDLPVDGPLMARIWKPSVGLVFVDGYEIAP